MQWACANSDKRPINPRTGRYASSADSNTWGTFHEALACAKQHGYRIGFMLSDQDPYSVIDLDDKEKNPASEEEKIRFGKIVNSFDSYTEVSVSGRGCHIVVRGCAPEGRGISRNHVEVYSKDRFIIFTGNVVRDLPIADRQELLGTLCMEMLRQTNPIHVEDAATEFVTPAAVTELRSALNQLNADDRSLWIAVGIALKSLGNTGRELWLSWSQTSRKYKPQDANEWNTFHPDHTGYAAIFTKAQRAGWINPKSNASSAQTSPSPCSIGEIDIDDLFSDLYLTDEDVEKMADAEFLIPNMIVRGHITAFVAPANGGKTTVFVYLCEKMAAMRMRVLYINVDGSPGDLKRHRAHAKKHGYQVIAPDAKDGKSIGDAMEKLKLLAKSGSRLDEYVFIIDTLKKFVDVIDKKQSKEFLQLMRTLSVKGATICLLGHVNKYHDANDKPIYEGTADLRNDVDNLIYLTPFVNQSNNTVEITSRPDKVRAIFEPKSYVIYSSEDRRVVEPDQVIKIMSTEDRTILDTIKSAIATGCSTQKDILAYALSHGIGPKKTRAALDRHSQGQSPEISVQRTGRAKDLHYSLAAN